MLRHFFRSAVTRPYVRGQNVGHALLTMGACINVGPISDVTVGSPVTYFFIFNTRRQCDVNMTSSVRQDFFSNNKAK